MQRKERVTQEKKVKQMDGGWAEEGGGDGQEKKTFNC